MHQGVIFTALTNLVDDGRMTGWTTTYLKIRKHDEWVSIGVVSSIQREDEDALLFIPKRKARECKAARRTRRVGMHCIYWQRGDALRVAVFQMYVQLKRGDAVFVWNVQRERVAPPEEAPRGGSCFVLQTSRSSSSTSLLSSLLPLNGCCLQGKGVTSSSVVSLWQY